MNNELEQWCEDELDEIEFLIHEIESDAKKVIADSKKPGLVRRAWNFLKSLF